MYYLKKYRSLLSIPLYFHRLKAIRRGTKKDALNEEEKTRLSAMEEEDEGDQPIMIKVFRLFVVDIYIKVE